MSNDNEENLESWKVLSTHAIYEFPPYLRLERQVVELTDGREIDDYHWLEMPSYCLICPYTDDGKIIMLRGYRHGAGKVISCLPGRLIEAGESPLDAAKRELMEETGYKSKSWLTMGNYVPHGNYGCGRVHLFQATNAVRVQSPNSLDLEKVSLEINDIDTVLSWISSGQIQTLGTLAAILLSQKAVF